MSLYTYKAKCINVVDGDTVDVQIDVGFKMTTVQRLRLLGVNTPERHQPGYHEATDFTAFNLLDREIYVHTEKTDSFGRYLAHIYELDLEGNPLPTTFNQRLLDENLAVPFMVGK